MVWVLAIALGSVGGTDGGGGATTLGAATTGGGAAITICGGGAMVETGGLTSAGGGGGGAFSTAFLPITEALMSIAAWRSWLLDRPTTSATMMATLIPIAKTPLVKR